VVSGEDGWAVYTDDDSLAAHIEHTVAVTEAGPRVLTQRSTARQVATG
jgi:methionyl aminopeptidase